MRVHALNSESHQIKLNLCTVTAAQTTAPQTNMKNDDIEAVILALSDDQREESE